MINRKASLGAIAGLTALTLSLTACGGGGGTTPTPGTSDKPVTIEYVHRLPDGEGMTKIADIVAKWNAANPDIQVTSTKFDGKADALIKKLETDAKAGAGPCLAQVGYAEVPSMFSKGLLADVTKDAATFSSNFSAGAIGLMTVGGVTVGLPQDTGPLVYYYNKAEFERLGLEVPKTMDDLATVAKKAAEQGKYVMAFQPDEAQYWLSAQAAGAGAVWYGAEGDKWTVDVTSPETAKVTEFWQGALDGKYALVENRWGDGFKASLVEQKLIGTIGAAWEAPLLSGDMAGSANEGQWAVTQLPKFGSEAMTGPDGGSGVAVMKGCEHPAGAMKFNNWFNTQIDDLTTQGLVVAAKGTVKTPADLAKFYSGQDIFAELGKANQALNPNFAYMPTWPAINDAMVTAATAAGAGTGTVAAIFEDAQKASIQSLKDGGFPVAE